MFMIPANKLDNLRDSVKAALKCYSLENGRKEVESYNPDNKIFKTTITRAFEQ